MVYSQTLKFKTRGDSDIINITDKVAAAVKASKIKNGIVVAFVQHTTAAITDE